MTAPSSDWMAASPRRAVDPTGPESLEHALQRARPTLQLLPETLVQHVPDPILTGQPRYAFDTHGPARAERQHREQVIRVEPDPRGYRVWTSVIYLDEFDQRFSMRKLPDSYHVTPAEELPDSVWVRPGNKPLFLTVEYVLDGSSITEGSVYADSPRFILDSYRGADHALEKQRGRNVPFSFYPDRERVVKYMREAADLGSEDNLQKADQTLMRGRNIVLAGLARQSAIPIGALVRWRGSSMCVLQDPAQPGRYIAPIGDRDVEIEFDADTVLPTKANAPGRKSFDAVMARQFRPFVTGREDHYSAGKVLEVLRSHNRQNYGNGGIYHRSHYRVA